ncbi:MAG TPA: hypothetical protein VFZ18_13810 [Longimicrobiaceae bacterium]
MSLARVLSLALLSLAADGGALYAQDAPSAMAWEAVRGAAADAKLRLELSVPAYRLDAERAPGRRCRENRRRELETTGKASGRDAP